MLDIFYIFRCKTIPRTRYVPEEVEGRSLEKQYDPELDRRDLCLCCEGIDTSLAPLLHNDALRAAIEVLLAVEWPEGGREGTSYE